MHVTGGFFLAQRGAVQHPYRGARHLDGPDGYVTSRCIDVR